MIGSAESSAALYASLATLVTALIGLAAILINTTVTLRGQRAATTQLEKARRNVAGKVDGSAAYLSAQVKDVHADVTEVKTGVETINGQTLGQLADADEGRRVETIPFADRTEGEQGYATRLEDQKKES